MSIGVKLYSKFSSSASKDWIRTFKLRIKSPVFYRCATAIFSLTANGREDSNPQLRDDKARVLPLRTAPLANLKYGIIQFDAKFKTKSFIFISLAAHGSTHSGSVL
jgi:hypothetical protein